jgi:hypothetical protein
MDDKIPVRFNFCKIKFTAFSGDNKNSEEIFKEVLRFLGDKRKEGQYFLIDREFGVRHPLAV